MESEDTEVRLAEREQTDESLRTEREKADHAIVDELAAIEEVADAVLSRARARADGVLATARAKTDRRSAASELNPTNPKVLARERGREDESLREERADADEVLRVERAEHIDLLSSDRETTDNDLFVERVRSDDVLATLDEVLRIVSRDLRSMLTSMIDCAAQIAKGVSRENHVEEVLLYARRIQRSGDRSNRLIGDLVDVASIDANILALTLGVGDPAHVVTEVVEAFREQASANGISLVAKIVPPASLAAFDPARLLQVLTSLLSNAIKFTRTGGTVVVSIERVDDEIRFAVADTGIGVPADKLDAVFERFHQVRKNDRRGVGLGLYISRAIVQGHGGRIWAESRIGEGSTFYFTLPVHVAGLTRENPPPALVA
jgi:signal transduction histidine kinase